MALTMAGTGRPQRFPLPIGRLLGLLTALLLLSACRVDVVVDIDVEPDGTGLLTVTATANPELVEQVPTIADDLVLDDIATEGWIIDGPAPTPDGGLVIVLTHDFAGDQEATNLLRSLGPPFFNPQLGRGPGDVTTNTLTGDFGLPNGFADFADTDLINAVGGVPFAEEFAAADVTPATAMSATVRARLPGEIVGDETNGTVLDDGRIEWVIPLEGQPLELTGRSQQSPSAGGSWARPLSIAALVALIAWVAFMTLFIFFVASARWRRARRYKRRVI